ncbi:hypothetical protein LCGC14_0434620 [marine sediment metagenome]|uniref:Uncharacterized protein n=1 Tax=marine sediment metagenome TaxID=412755 RepID=A0A0F9SLX6_9ZZZZ
MVYHKYSKMPLPECMQQSMFKQILVICPKCKIKKYIFERYFNRSRCVCGSKFKKFKASRFGNSGVRYGLKFI